MSDGGVVALPRRLVASPSMTTHDRPFGRHLEDFTPGGISAARHAQSGQCGAVPVLGILAAALAGLGFEKWRAEWGRRAVRREVEQRPTWHLEQVTYRFSPLLPAWIVRYDVAIRVTPTMVRSGRATVRGAWISFADPEVEIDFDGA